MQTDNRSSLNYRKSSWRRSDKENIFGDKNRAKEKERGQEKTCDQSKCFKAAKHSLTEKKKSSKQERYEKICHLQEMKKIQIEQLNCKIKLMIDKADVDDDSKQTLEIDKSHHQRVKTQCFDSCFEGNQRENQTLKFGTNGEGNIIVESKIVTPTFTTQEPFFKSHNRSRNEQQLEKIKMKYKNSRKASTQNNRLKTQNFHHRKSSIQSLQSSCKSNAMEKTDSLVLNFGRKRTICEEIQSYQKKVNNYQVKRQNLLKQCEKVVLKNSTNFFNNVNQKKKIPNDYSFSFNETPRLGIEALEKKEEKKKEQKSLKMFLENLLNQIKLDEEFRQAKMWLQNECSPNKWQQIESLLRASSLFLSQSETKSIFSLEEQQTDPFYSFRHDDFTFDSIVQLFIKGQEHWEQQIVHQYDVQTLEKDGFKEEILDKGRKGWISVSDLVRFVNLEKDVQFRNRDVYLIYRRLKVGKKLTFSDFVQQISLNS